MDGPGQRRTTSVSEQDPRPARRQARFEEILAAAWQIASEQGLAAISLHEVARRVGLRQPSLYAYIDSKAALYDAMFAQAANSLLEHVRDRSYSTNPREAVREACQALYEFAPKNSEASLLLFARTVPGFEPSPVAYRPAQDYFSMTVQMLQAAGVTQPGDIDIFISIIAGLINQQQTNEPGGDRWTRHLDTVLDMFFRHIDHQAAAPFHGRQPTNSNDGSTPPRSPTGDGRLSNTTKENR